MKNAFNNCRKRVAVLAAVAGLLAGAAGVFAENIRLQAKVAVDARQDVRLGDIATITGGNAQENEELASTVILSGVQRTQKVQAESVLMAVLAQRGTSGMGSLQISGAAECEISVGGKNAPNSVNIAVPATIPTVSSSSSNVSTGVSSVSSAVPSVSSTSAAQSISERAPLRQTIAETLKKAINLPEGDYEISIDSTSPFLDAAVDARRQWLCRPLTKTLLGTVPVEAQLVEGTKVVEKLNVPTTVLHKQMVVVVMKNIGAGEVVTADAVQVQSAMLDRKIPTLFGTLSSVVGLEAQRDVPVGERADQHDFKPALMAHKGQPVTVVYVSGPMQAQILGQAMEDAKRNERIEIRNNATGQTYSAVMIAKGIGVAGGSLTDEQEQKIVAALR